MASQCNLELISKLRSDAALYLPYDGVYAGRGPRRVYGEKIAPRNIPGRYLRQTTVEGEIETRIYQLQARHKTFAQMLNVVVIVKRNVLTQAQAHVILFSSARELPFETLIDEYCLR